jgi:hypothetical protein
VAREGHVRYGCAIYGTCTLGPNDGWAPDCQNCKLYAAAASPPPKDFLDPLKVYTADGQPTHALRNMLRGGAAFLVCGGPSLKTVDYRRLSERGIFSLGINNVAGLAPVSAFCCSDPPSKFHSGIFLDPKVIKLLPAPKLRPSRGAIRKKNQDGSFSKLPFITADCPNTWGFDRREWLTCDDTWFTEPSASWGNMKNGVERTGERKTACTMLLGLRLLQYLGARRIFLLGVDFHMSPTAGQHNNYAFGQSREPDSVKSNNTQYEITNDWLVRLRPVFERWGFGVYNCNQYSHLRAFDYVPFEQALEVCRGPVPVEPFDLAGWYEK